MSSLLPFPFFLVPFQATIVHSLFIPCCYLLMLFTNGLLLFVNVLLLIHQCLIVTNIIVICPCFAKCNIHYGCSPMFVTYLVLEVLIVQQCEPPISGMFLICCCSLVLHYYFQLLLVFAFVLPYVDTLPSLFCVPCLGAKSLNNLKDVLENL